MAFMKEPSLMPKGLGGSSTKLLEIKETTSASDRSNGSSTSSSTASTTTASTASVKLLRGIHISELYGSTINPDPLVDKKLFASSSSSSKVSSMRSSKQRQMEISASAAKSEYVVDKNVVVTEHLTENLMRQLTGCADLSTLRGLEIKITATADSTVGNFGSFLPQLRKLKLSDSSVSCMREIGTGFNNLKVLWMSRCGLEDLDGVSAMHNLREVYLSYNLISDLSPCGMLDSLEVLDLEGNSIDEVDQVDFLSLCTSLTHLTLEGNPVCLMPNPSATSSEGYDYRDRVFNAVPHLQFLDDVKFEAKTKAKAPSNAAPTIVKEKKKSTTSSASSNPSLTPDFAGDWAFINSFLGGNNNNSSSSSSSNAEEGGGEMITAAAAATTTTAASSTGKLTVRDICGDTEELYRKTAKSSSEDVGRSKGEKDVSSIQKAPATTSTATVENTNTSFSPSSSSPHKESSSNLSATAPITSSSSLSPVTKPTSPSSNAPTFRVRSTIVTSARRPLTSAAGRRPSTSSSAAAAAPNVTAATSIRPTTSAGGPRPKTAPTSSFDGEEGEGVEDAVEGGGRRRTTYSELTVGATVCGSISRSLKSRNKKSLPTFIDLDPQSNRRPQTQGAASSGYGTSIGTNSSNSSHRTNSSNDVDDSVFEAAPRPKSGKSDVDDLDLNPLKISASPPPETRKTAFASSSKSSVRSSTRSSAKISSTQSGSIDKIDEEAEDFDDDFVIHVVDSAQQQQLQQQQQKHQLEMEESTRSSADSPGRTSSSSTPSSASRIASASSGAIPKLFRVPTPPSTSKSPSTSASSSASSGVSSSRRARMTARLSADGRLQGDAAATTILPPLNPLKKSF